MRAEPTLGHQVTVSHGAVERLMRRTGLESLSSRPTWRRAKPAQRQSRKRDYAKGQNARDVDPGEDGDGRRRVRHRHRFPLKAAKLDGSRGAG